jgi:predicted small metal-binding protein
MWLLCAYLSELECQMKTMTCKQLGGACDLEFRANTFEEISELSKQHGMEMHQKQDSAHLGAMQKMGKLMKNPEDMSAWFEARRQEFDALPDS